MVTSECLRDKYSFLTEDHSKVFVEANEDITEDNVDYQSDTGSDVSRAQLGAEDICHAVDCLFRVAVHLAKRLIKDDFSKATSIDVSMFEYSDLQYVHDKFPEAEGWFLKRVAKGLFKRRQYLKYRELRSAEIPKSSEEAPDFVEEGHEIDNKGKSVLLSTTETTFAETPEFPRPAPTDDSASVDSATTYSSMIGKASGMPRLPNDAIVPNRLGRSGSDTSFETSSPIYVPFEIVKHPRNFSKAAIDGLSTR
ncbi:hypothetical protein MMC10_001127 [Thelotrema lepadinum]|nr:hypothetical protein [Thelotrema lepadinum]